MHYGQIVQSHALHFFHLSSPDLLFGFDERGRPSATSSASPPPFPSSRARAFCTRKFGQEVIRHIVGKRIHGTGAFPAA